MAINDVTLFESKFEDVDKRLHLPPLSSRPSITWKTLFDLGELPWFLHFLNTPVPICFYASYILLSKENQLANKQLYSVEVDIANQHWLLGADIRWPISS